jgi:peptide-methionine (S)-S-oxide reductase
MAGDDRQDFEVSMTQSVDVDSLFRDAVSAIDAGEVERLQRLIDEHPFLVSARLESPGAWLRERVGPALNGFFGRPFLLWFVAEDPVRNGRLPVNIAEVVRVITRAATRQGVPTLQEQLDTTLRLVCWSGVAVRFGVQLEMIDALVDAGALPAQNANNALVNGHLAAAERLIARGGELTLAAALCLDRWEDVPRLAAEANPRQRQFAFVLAALNGKSDAVKWMIGTGIPISQPSADLYSHGTPLHHAVCSGSLETVRALVEAGADVNRPDEAWNGTPLGWAQHYVDSSAGQARERYASIVSYLRDRISMKG